MNKSAYLLLLALGLSCLVAASSPVRAGESITNADIIQMTRAGLTPDVVITAIQSSPNAFDLSTRSVLQLSENGVGDEVLKAMYAAAAGSGGGGGAQQERFASELANVSSSQPEVRDAAIAWFLANKEAVLPELRNNLLSTNAANRSATALVLGRMADLQSVGALRNMLTDASPEVRKNAAQALFNLNDQQAVAAADQALARRLDPLDGFIRLVGYFKQTRHAETLGGILSANPEAVNRIAAAWAIGEIGRAGVAGRPALEKALASDTDPIVRCEAAKAIARFNDSTAATSLIDACRTDPSVRKTTLQLLADYPEAVDFLVSVMNLGQDLISVDEIEAARASLTRLAGRDLGRDGQAWSEWLAQNRSRFPGSAGGTVTAQANQADIFAGIPGVPMSATASRNEPIDVAAWGIIADSAMIPIAPMPGESATSTSSSSGFASSGAAATPSAGMSFGGVPSLVPDMDMPDIEVPSSTSTSQQFQASQVVDVAPQAPASSGRTQLRTWSSDPDRVGGSASRQTATAPGEVPGWAGAFEPIEQSSDDTPKHGEIINAATLNSSTASFSSAPSTLSADASESAESSTFTSTPSGPSSLSSYGITGSSASQAELTGIALPIPPFDSGDDSALSSSASDFPSPASPVPAPSTPASPDFFSTYEPAASSGATESSEEDLGGWTRLYPTDMPETPDDGLNGWTALTPTDTPADAPTNTPAVAPAVTPAPKDEDAVFYPSPSDDWPSFPAPAGADADSSFADPYADWSELADDNSDPFASPSSDSMPPSLMKGGFPMEDEPMVVSGSMPEAPVETVPESFAPALLPQDNADVFTSELPESPYASMEETVTQTDESAASSPVPPAPVPTPVAEEPAYRSDLFVEPEPGQYVITDDNPHGAPYQPPQAAVEAPVFNAPSVDVTESDVVAADQPLPVPEPVVDAAAAAPVTTDSGSSSASREVFRSSSPAPEPPPITEPIQPGDPNVNYAASQQLAPPPAESSGNFLVDPSVPLPPVRPEGTISVPEGKNLPLLGEGFF